MIRGDDPLPLPVPPPDEIGGEADRILSRPEFQEPEPTLFDRIFDWIGERLGDLFGVVFGGGPGTVIGVIVLLGLFAVVVYFASKAGQIGGIELPRRNVPTLVTVTTERVSADQWFAEADRHRANGEWRGAVRCRFQGVVSVLLDREIVVDEPGRTNTELRSDVARRAPAAHDAFDALSTRFDAAWYGGIDVSREDVDDADALARRVLDTAELVEHAEPATAPLVAPS